jgi:hypothetical protein
MTSMYIEYAALQQDIRNRHQALALIEPNDPGYEEAIERILKSTTDLLDLEDKIESDAQHRVDRYVTAMLILFTLSMGAVASFAVVDWRWLLIPIVCISVVLTVAHVFNWVTTAHDAIYFVAGTAVFKYNVGVGALAVTLLLAVTSVWGLLSPFLGVIGILISASIGSTLLGLRDLVRQVREWWNVAG